MLATDIKQGWKSLDWVSPVSLSHYLPLVNGRDSKAWRERERETERQRLTDRHTDREWEDESKQTGKRKAIRVPGENVSKI